MRHEKPEKDKGDIRKIHEILGGYLSDNKRKCRTSRPETLYPVLPLNFSCLFFLEEKNVIIEKQAWKDYVKENAFDSDLEKKVMMLLFFM